MPFHQRVAPVPAGSGYQPGGGGGCVTSGKLALRTGKTAEVPCQTPAMADLTGAEARALDAVDEAWLVDRLCAMVAVPSIGGTPAEREVQHLLAGWLAELDCDVDTWPIDLDAAATDPEAPGQEVVRTEAWGVVGTAPAAEDGVPALVLSGHTDVVPPGDLAEWDGDPFVPRIADGAVHGR